MRGHASPSDRRPSASGSRAGSPGRRAPRFPQPNIEFPPILTDFPFFAIVVPGLEKIAGKEIRELASDVSLGPGAEGLVSFEGSISLGRLLELRCVEDVYATLALVRPFRSDLSGIAQVFRAARRTPLWDDALALFRSSRPARVRRLTYRVVSQLSGRHDFRRIDLQTAVETAIDQRAKGAWKRLPEHASMEFWIRGDRFTAALGIRLSDNTMRHRTYKTAQLPASLKPTVAAAMVRLTDPQSDDLFLDPMCGSGTLLIERALAGRYAGLIGGDADPNALDATRANVGPRHQPIRIEPMDVRCLPAETASIDKLATNMPFGRQIQPGSSTLPELYSAGLQEFARVVKPGGRAVILAAEDGEWRESVHRTGAWTVRGRYPIDLLGQRPTILVLDRG